MNKVEFSHSSLMKELDKNISWARLMKASLKAGRPTVLKLTFVSHVIDGETGRWPWCHGRPKLLCRQNDDGLMAAAVICRVLFYYTRLDLSDYTLSETENSTLKKERWDNKNSSFTTHNRWAMPP